MIIEICVGVISIAFVVLVVYLVITLHKVIETLKTANDLALDIKEKSEALNVVFRPLTKFGKKKEKHSQNYEKIIEIINFATDGIVLFNRLKRKH
jgi:uncharacterized protein YoxC